MTASLLLIVQSTVYIAARVAAHTADAIADRVRPTIGDHQ